MSPDPWNTADWYADPEADSYQPPDEYSAPPAASDFTPPAPSDAGAAPAPSTFLPPPQELSADDYSYHSPYDTTPYAPPPWATQAPSQSQPTGPFVPQPPPDAPSSGGPPGFGPFQPLQADVDQFGQGFQVGMRSVMGAPLADFVGDIFGRPLQTQGQALGNILPQTQELIGRPDSGAAPLAAAGTAFGQAAAAANPFSDLSAQQRAEQGVSGLATGLEKTMEAVGNPSVAGAFAADATRAGQAAAKAAADVGQTIFMIGSPAVERLFGRIGQALGTGNGESWMEAAARAASGQVSPDVQVRQAYNTFRAAQGSDVQAKIDDYAASTAYSGDTTHLAGAQAIASGVSVDDAINQHQDLAREMLGQTVFNPLDLVHPVLQHAGLTHDAAIAGDFQRQFMAPITETPADTLARMAARGDTSVTRPLIYNLARDEQRIALADSREIVNQIMPPNLSGPEFGDWLGKFASGTLADEHPVFADLLNSEKGREARLLVQTVASRTEPDLSASVTAKLSPATRDWIERQRGAGAEDPEIYNRLKPDARAIVDRLSPLGEADPAIIQKIMESAATPQEAMARLTGHLGRAVERLIPVANPGRLDGPISALKNLAHWGYIASSPGILVHKFVNDVEGMLADHLFTTAPLEHINAFNAAYGFNEAEAGGLRGTIVGAGVGRALTEHPQTAAQMLGVAVRERSPHVVSDLLNRMTTNFRARMISEGIRQSVVASSRSVVESFSRAFPDAARFPPEVQALLREELRGNLTKDNLARVSKLVQAEYPELFGRGDMGTPPTGTPAEPAPIPPRPPSPNTHLTRDPDTLDPVQRRGVAAVRELDTMPEGERIKSAVAQAQVLPPEAKAAEIARIQSEEATAHQVRADLAEQSRKDAFQEVNTVHPVEATPTAEAPKEIAAKASADAVHFEQEFAQHKAVLADAMARGEPDVKAFTNATTRLEGDKLKLWDEWYYQPVEQAYQGAKNTPYGAARDTAWRKAESLRSDANQAAHMGALVRADDYFAAHNNGSHVDGPIDRFGKAYGLMSWDGAAASEMRARMDGLLGKYTRDATAAHYPDAKVPEPVKAYEPMKAEPVSARVNETLANKVDALAAEGKSSREIAVRLGQTEDAINRVRALRIAPTADLMLSRSLDESGFKGGYPHLINAINVDRAAAGQELLGVPPKGSAPGAWREALKGATLEEAVKASSDRIAPPRATIEESAQDIVQHMADAGTAVGLMPDEIAAQSTEALQNVSLEARTPDGRTVTVTGDATGLAQPDAIRQAADAAGSRSAAAAPEGREAGGLAGVDAAGGQAASGHDVPAEVQPVASKPLTRAAYEQQLLATARKVGIKPAEARAQIALMNVAIENIATLTGKSVDEVYGKYIAGVTDKVPERQSLFQTEPFKSAAELQRNNLANQLPLFLETDKAVRYEVPGSDFWKAHPQYMGHDYETLAKTSIVPDRWRMEYQNGNWVLQDRISRETIAQGPNRYDVMVRGNKTLEARGYVGFEPKDEVLRQASGDIQKGARSLTADGRQMLHLFQNTADASTLAHESAHMLRGMFEDVANETQHPQLLADNQYMREWASDGRRVWDVAAEEKLARGFERYVADGVAPTSRLERVFQQMSGWLKDIYSRISGDPQIPGQIPARLREAFDGWFDERIAGGNSRVADGVVPNDMYKFLSETYSPDDVRQMPQEVAHFEFNRIHEGLVNDARQSLDEIAFNHRLESSQLRERIASGELPKPRDLNRFFELNTENPTRVVGKKAWSAGTDWEPYGAAGPGRFADSAGYSPPKRTPMGGGTWHTVEGHELDQWRENVSEILTGSPNRWSRVEEMVKDYQASQRAILDGAAKKREAANVLAQVQRDPQAAAEFGKQAAAASGQGQMFTGGEDSPLLSGVAPSAPAQAFNPQETGQQAKMFSTAPEMGQQTRTPLQQAEADARAKAAASRPGALFQTASAAVSDAPFDRMDHVRQMSARNVGDVQAAADTPVKMASLFRSENGTPMYARYAVDGEKGWGNDKFVFLGAKPPDTLGKFKAEGPDMLSLRDTFKDGGAVETARPLGVMDRVGGGKAVVLTSEVGSPLTATIPAEAYRLAKQLDPDAQFMLGETSTPGQPLVVVVDRRFETKGYIMAQGPQETARAERVFGLTDGVPHPEDNQAPTVLPPRPPMPTETAKPPALHDQMDTYFDAAGQREVHGDTAATLKAQRDAAYAVQHTDARAELADALRKGEMDPAEHAQAAAQLDAGQVAPTLRNQGEAHALTPAEWQFRGERTARAIDALDAELSARAPGTGRVPPDGATRTGAPIDPQAFDRALQDWGAGERLKATRTAIKRGQFAMPDGPQTNLDRGLDYVQPFHYWMTRNARNWAVRALEHPEFISAYLNFQNYLKQTNAKEPKQFQQSLKTSWDGSPLYFDVLKTLNPLERFVNNYQMQNTTNDPGITALNMGANVGVNPWFPLKWLYALSIHAKDPTAFRQLIGHDIPLSADIKYGTAAIRQATGGKGPFGAIPPGGTYLEGMLFKELGSGDGGENNRIGKALYQMYANGQTNPETGKPVTLDEAKRAAFNQEHAADLPNGAKTYPNGTLWDAATQASAVKRGAPELMTWLGVKGVTLVDKIDATVAQARKDWAALPWSGGDSEQLKTSLRNFYDQYPWYGALTLSNKDSQDRSALFASDVLSRIPPGGKTALYDAAGVKDLVGGFFAAKGALGKADYINNLPADQQQKFMGFIAQVDKSNPTPGKDTQAEWDAYNKQAAIYFAPGMTAAERAQMKAGSPLLQKYMGTSDAERFWGTYYGLDKLGQQIVRAELPNLGAYIDKGTRGTVDAAGVKALANQLDSFAAGLKATPSYQQYQAELLSKFGGAAILNTQAQYYAIDKNDKPALAKFRADNPSLTAYWNWKDGFLATHLDLKAALAGAAVKPVQPGAATPSGVTSTQPAAAKLSPASAQAYHDYYAARDARYGGVDVAGLQQKYFAIPATDKAARAALIQANPQLADYFAWHTQYLKANPAFAAATQEASQLYQSQRAVPGTTPAAPFNSQTAAHLVQALAPMQAELNAYYASGGSRGFSSAGGRLFTAARSRYAPKASSSSVLNALRPYYRTSGAGGGITPFYRQQDAGHGGGAGGSAPYIRTVRYISSPYERRR